MCTAVDWWHPQTALPIPLVALPGVSFMAQNCREEKRDLREEKDTGQSPEEQSSKARQEKGVGKDRAAAWVISVQGSGAQGFSMGNGCGLGPVA